LLQRGTPFCIIAHYTRYHDFKINTYCGEAHIRDEAGYMTFTLDGNSYAHPTLYFDPNNKGVYYTTPGGCFSL